MILSLLETDSINSVDVRHMKLGYLQITKKTKPGDCFQCEKSFKIGKIHVTVSLKIGPRRGHTRSRFINWHLHMECLALWMIAQMIAKQDRRKPAGRPIGTGLNLAPGDKNRRLAILKRRARLFKEVEECSLKDLRLTELYQKFVTIGNELDAVGGKANVNLRTTLNLQDIEKKLRLGKERSTMI